MEDINKYKNYWEHDKKRYALLHLREHELPTIYNWYHHSMVMLDVDVETARIITQKMIEAGVEVFKSWDDYHRKYPEISSEERRRRMTEFPDSI